MTLAPWETASAAAAEPIRPAPPRKRIFFISAAPERRRRCRARCRSDQVVVAAPQGLERADVQSFEFDDVPLDAGGRGQGIGPVDPALADGHHDVVLVADRRPVLHVDEAHPVPEPGQHFGRIGAAHRGPVRVELHQHAIVELVQQHVVRLPAVEDVGELREVVVVRDPHATGGCSLGGLVHPLDAAPDRVRRVELLAFHAPHEDLGAELLVRVEDRLGPVPGRERRVRAGQGETRRRDRVPDPGRAELLDQPVGLHAREAEARQALQRALEVGARLVEHRVHHHADVRLVTASSFNPAAQRSD